MLWAKEPARYSMAAGGAGRRAAGGGGRGAGAPPAVARGGVGLVGDVVREGAGAIFDARRGAAPPAEREGEMRTHDRASFAGDRAPRDKLDGGAAPHPAIW